MSTLKWLEYGGGIQWQNGIGNVTSIKNFLAAATQLNIRLGLITYHYTGLGTLHYTPRSSVDSIDISFLLCIVDSNSQYLVENRERALLLFNFVEHTFKAHCAS